MKKQIPRLLAVALLVAAAGSAAAGGDCARVVAIGDLHGDVDAFRTMLHETGLVDDALRWKDDGACLVQLGDFLDRGARSRELLDLLMDLQARQPERVEVLLGNHEVLNLLGDLRYTTPEDFAAFAADETAQERQAGFEAYRRMAAAAGETASDEALRREFDEKFPPGFFARRRAFGLEGRYGSWLLRRPVAVRIGGTVFMHAGLRVEDAKAGLAALTEHVHAELREFLECRAQLEAWGWIPPLTDYAESFRALHRRLEAVAGNGKTPDRNEAAVIARYVSQLEASTVDPEGPMWYRGLAVNAESLMYAEVNEILSLLDAERLVLAHTPSDEATIRSRFGGRVFLIDTLAGPDSPGQPSALEIDADGVVHAVYVGRREKLAEPVLTDTAIERALGEGKVIEEKVLEGGITKPKKLTLEYRGREFEALFKTVDIQSTGLTRFESSGAELNFRDSYLYERAAYLLDRELGLFMVPVTVLREIDGKEGALVAWVADAESEMERQERGEQPADPLAHKRQKDVMLVFDALILNVDRHLSNELVTADGRLHLIDHSRSFRLSKKLPAGFDAGPISLPRELYEGLKGLEAKRLRVLLRGTVSGPQIKALLARRDRIVQKVERDLAAYGEEIVFPTDAVATTPDPSEMTPSASGVGR